MRWRRWRSWLVVVVVAAAGGCRGHLAVCDDESCDNESEASGGAPSIGAGGSHPSGESGEGGEGGATCADDRECDNGLRCDGEERCTASGCGLGEAIECASGTSCAEQGPEACVFAERSPWLVLTALDELRGLPTALLGKEPLAVLGRHPRVTQWTGFDRLFWSPDGRFLVARAAEVQFGYSLSYLRFGDGLPSSLRHLPELPNWSADADGSEAFSPDSRLFFAADGDSDGFLFDLQAAELTARPLGTLGVEFCQESGVWLADDELHELNDGEISSRPLPSGDLHLSPDRTLIAVARLDEEGETIGVTLVPCGRETWSAELPFASPQFSADSTTLWLEDDAGHANAFELADPKAPRALGSTATSASTPWHVSPNGRYLIAERDDLYYLVDARARADEPPAALNLPEYVEPIRLTNDGLLAWSTWESNEPRDLIWQPIPPRDAPIVLHHDLTGLDDWVFDARRPHELLIAAEDDRASWLLRIDLRAPEKPPEELISVDGGVTAWVPAPDGSGVAFSVLTGTLTREVRFARFDASGKLGESVLLSDSAYDISFQPWP